MKRFKKADSEIMLGGIFGIVSIASIIVEVLIGNFEAAAIAGGIKDIAGTIVAVMVFIFAAKNLFKKEDKSFHSVFAEEMVKLENKYTPLLIKAEDNGDERKAEKLRKKVVYELSTNIESLMSGQPSKYAAFFEFEISNPDKITFFINKTTFMGPSTESFEPLRETITLKIENGILRRHNDLGKKFKPTSSGFEIKFDKVLDTKDDARMLANFVDSVMLLYIAACKK